MTALGDLSRAPHLHVYLSQSTGKYFMVKKTNFIVRFKKNHSSPLHFRYSSGDIFQVQQFSVDTQQSTESSICAQIIANPSKLEIGKSFTISF